MKRLFITVLVAILICTLLYTETELMRESELNVEITRVYTQEIPATRFIGKRYFNEDRENYSFTHKWHLWFENEWFDVLRRQVDVNLCEVLFEDASSTIGLMRIQDGEPFEYWIGKFKPENTKVPEGFLFHDFPESRLGIGWVHGQPPHIYWACAAVATRLREEGHEIISDENGVIWTFERYSCPRFTTPDEHGNRTLDRGYFIN